jgi:hypothetical protein
MARRCANESTQRIFTNKGYSASTDLTDSFLITSTIEAKEIRDVTDINIPNAFVQTDINIDNGEPIMIKIKGLLVDKLVEMDPESCVRFVV